MTNLWEIDLKSIKRSPYNSRKVNAKDPRTVQLADSIKAIGVLQPPTVRAKGKGYELVAGERRWCAAKVAGLESIEVLVRELTDRQACEICVTENLQREDLLPLEEAHGVALLLTDYAGDVRAVAAQLGRSVGWVARRSRLATLSDRWRELVANPESEASEMSAGQLELIARLAPAAQDQLIDGHGRPPWNLCNGSVSQTERYLAQLMREVKGAPWKADAPVLDIIACTDCMQRSTCVVGLFDDELEGDPPAGPLGRCLDAACWDRKLHAYIEEREAALRAKHGADLLLIGDRYRGALGDNVHDSNDYKAAKKADKDSRPALVVQGPGAGKMRWVAPQSWASGSSPAKGGKKTLKEKEAGLKKRRRLRALELIRVAVKELAPPLHLISLAATFGTSHRHETMWAWDEGKNKRLNSWDTYRTLVDRTAAVNADRRLWDAVAGVLCQRLMCNQVDEAWKDAASACKALELPAPEKYFAQAVEEISEPKAWAKERKELKKAKAEASRAAAKKKAVKA